MRRVLEHRLLVWDRHAQARQRPPRRGREKLVELLGRHPKGQVHRVDAGDGQGCVVDHGRQAVGHRIGDHAIDPRRRGDRFVAVHLPHLPPADLAGGENAVVVERGEGEGGAEPAAEDPGRNADLAHADSDRGQLAGVHHLEHPQVIGGVIRHPRDLHHIRVHRGQPLVQQGQVGWGLLKVVVADDPLRRPVPRDACGDVVFEVNVVGSFDDRGPQQRPPSLLRMLPAAAVALPPTRHDHRAGAIPEQPPHLHLALDVIKPQLDEADAVFHQMLVLGDHVPVPAAANAHADHRRSSEVNVLRMGAGSVIRVLGERCPAGCTSPTP